MRKLRMTTAALLVAAAGCLSPSPVAADDFDALLADLSFSAVPSYARDVSPPLQTAEPADLMGGLQTAPTRRQSTVAATLNRPTAPEKAAATQTFDLDAAIAVSQMESSRTAASTVGCRQNGAGLLGGAHGGCDAASCDAPSCGGGCDGCCAAPAVAMDRQCTGCRHQRVEEFVCVPKRPVNLPRSSFYEYFNARPSDVNVWDGYSQQPCKLYEGDPPAHGHECLCSGCAGCGEVLEPCAAPRVARMPKISCPKIAVPEVRFPIRQIAPPCDAGNACDSCD